MNITNKKPLILYFILAIGITWGIAIIFVKRHGEQTLTGLIKDEINVKEEKKVQKTKLKTKN
jgi:hypothetical protein